MKKAVYPGTFDPVTFGHIDVIKRSSKMFDELVVGILTNVNKEPLFTVEERVDMITNLTKDIPNVSVATFDGLQIDFARCQKADFIVRGLRAVTDFEYELLMSQTNRILAPELDTIFLTTSLEYSYLSSSTVREVASFGGDISHFVPEEIEKLVKAKYSEFYGDQAE